MEKEGKKDMLKIGMIGTGKISRQFCDAAKKSGFVLRTVLSRKKETGDEYAREVGIPEDGVVTDPSVFFHDPRIDCVYIASPNALHFEQAMAALEGGKHVLCEKPLTTDLARFDLLAAKAKEKGLVLMEGMRILHDPVFKTVTSLLPKLGKIRRADFEYCQYSSRYDRFKAGELPNAFNPDLSNASVMDIGVYTATVCVALFGLPDSFLASSLFLSNGFEGAGNAVLNYDRIGMQTVLSWSKITDSAVPSVITGENGSLMLDRISGPTKLTLCLRGKEKEDIPFENADNDMVFECSDFKDAICNGSDLSAYLKISRETVILLDGIREKAGIRFPSDVVTK